MRKGFDQQQKNDCFLCNLIPAIFPVRNNIIVEDPSTTTSRRNTGLPPIAAPGTGVPLSSAATASQTRRSTETMEDDNEYHKTNLDFANADYRGFVFAIHPQHGFMLLHCTRKKKKPNHFQLPGGHIDPFEFTNAAKVLSSDGKRKGPTTASSGGGGSATIVDLQDQLVLAGKMGAARELYEETGMDLRQQMERLQPAKLFKKNKKDRVPNEYKQRLFYVLHLTDDDFLRPENMPIADAAFLQRPMGAQPPNLMVRQYAAFDAIVL